MRLARAAAVLLGLAAPVGVTVACGARSGLLLGGILSNDAAALDDGSADVVPPPIDVTPPRDVVIQRACADASDTLIYTVTTDTTGTNNYQLLKFNPSSAQFSTIGTLSCPDPNPQEQPFSMAVDQQGNAYVLYFDPNPNDISNPGSIYKVNLNTAACAPTAYVGTPSFSSFGMAFVSNDVGPGETLFVATNNNNTTTSGSLGAIDETSLALAFVGVFSPRVIQAELTGTGDGRLFAFWAPNTASNPGAAIAQIDKATAAVIGQDTLPAVTQGGGWAFAFYGGQFYLFTAPNATTANDPTTVVQRYDPRTGTVVRVASYPQTVVGAGVSTCAPVQ